MADQKKTDGEIALLQIDSVLQRIVALASRLMWDASHTKVGTDPDGEAIWDFGPHAVTFVNEVDGDFSDQNIVASVAAAYPKYAPFALAAVEAFREWQDLASEYAKDPFADRVMPGVPWQDVATKPLKDKIDVVLNKFHKSAGRLNAILPHARHVRDPNELFAA